jgi:zinc protease
VVVKAPAKMPVLLMGYKVPSLKTTQDESEVYALEVLAGILDGGNSARLSTSLVRGKQLAVSVDASYDMASRLDSLFQLSAVPVEGKTHADLEAALKAEVNKLQQNLVSPDELKRIKAQVLANEVYEKDSNFNQAMQLGALESVGLPWQKTDEYVDKINQVTAEQVQAVAKKYLIDDHLTVGYLEPIAIKQAPATKQETQTAPMTMKGER